MARVALMALGLTMLLCAPAVAHVERTSYWPDPTPDKAVKPSSGGAVPKVRTLASAVARKQVGKTRVVCQADSMKRLKRSIASARKIGYTIRPTDRRRLSKASAKRLLKINKTLYKRCRFHEIQPAVSASGNNDRVVVMPGLYTEPTSRAVPSFPPACDKYRITSENGTGAVSYSYQLHCPNAQALVGVIGRNVGSGEDPKTSPGGRPDPHGIPNEGGCIRCNLQLEGSGPAPDDVIVDAGRVESGNGAPINPKKDVGIKADRADGFVLRNMTVRHAAEHDVYILETDGYRMDRMKYFYAGEYGALMFASDHGLTSNCEGAGHGDSAVYPGGAPDTGALRNEAFYPVRRLNQTITHCDLHHNNLGYSGTMGNATHVIDNNFYDNTTGIATDSFYAGGHPGFPQDSAVFERNRIYSNNFNVYASNSDVKSAVPVPIGVGILIGGGDDDQVARNYIYDNWRRGTMLVAVPDVISCAPSPENGAPPCAPQGAATTSQRNLYFDNVMGRSVDGKSLPNGVDFWWDEFASNRGNCWYSNTGSKGTAESVTSDPPPPPAAGTSVPGYLPEDCNGPGNVGMGNSQKEAMLVACLGGMEATNSQDPNTCEWFAPPAKPGTQEAAAQQAFWNQRSQALAAQHQTAPRSCHLFGSTGGTLTCDPFKRRLG
jgi:hypothetical protein